MRQRPAAHLHWVCQCLGEACMRAVWQPNSIQLGAPVRKQGAAVVGHKWPRVCDGTCRTDADKLFKLRSRTLLGQLLSSGGNAACEPDDTVDAGSASC